MYVCVCMCQSVKWYVTFVGNKAVNMFSLMSHFQIDMDATMLHSTTNNCLFHHCTGNCNSTTPCQSGFCYANKTGCPLTGYHQVRTNLTADDRQQTITTDNTHLYYHSCAVTLVLVVFAATLMLVMKYRPSQNRYVQTGCV